MKKFILKTIIFTAIALSMLFVLNYLYVNTNYYKSQNTFKFKNVPDKLEIVNLGNSHGGKGIDYSFTDYKGFNFALPAQNFHYDYRILSQYADKIKEGGIVIIPVAYFSLWEDYSSEDRFKARQDRYYDFLSPEYFDEFSVSNYITQKMLPVLNAGISLRYIINDKNTVLAEADIAKENQFKISELDQVAVERANHHKNIINEYGEFEASKDKLNKIISVAKSNNLKPVLITVPYLNYYNQQFSSDLLKKFRQEINEIAENNKIIYLDYSHSDKFQSESNLFLDTDHLNLVGREKFTKILINDLQQIEILKRGSIFGKRTN
jgi:hypothetical protein